MDIGTKDTHTTPSPQSAGIVKKTRSAWSTVAFFFLLLLMISLGVAAWLWSSWQNAENQTALSKSEVKSAQSTIADLRQKLGEAHGQAAAEAGMPINDEALIKEVVTRYNAALASPLKDIKIDVTRREGNQAIASVSDVTAGYKAYLKKSNNAWIVIYSGQNNPPADIIKQFDLVR